MTAPRGFLASLDHARTRYQEVNGLDQPRFDPPWNPTYIREPGEPEPRVWQATMPTPPSLWGLALGLLRLIGGRR